MKTNSYVDENLEMKKKIHASFVSKINRPIVEVPAEEPDEVPAEEPAVEPAEEPTVEPEKNELENEEREPRENRGSSRRKGGN